MVLKTDKKMKQTRIITAFVMLSLLASACQNNQIDTTPAPGKTIEVKMRPVAAQTKAMVNVAADDIHAYTYGDPDAYNCGAFLQTGKENGVYSYSLPAGTESIIFSNQVSDSDFALGKLNEGGLTIERRDGTSLYDKDIVAGAAYLEDVDAEGTLTVHLNRLNSFVTADLQMEDLDGNALNLSDYMSSAYLRLPNQAKSVSYNIDGSITVSSEVLNTPVDPEIPDNPDDPDNPNDPDNPDDPQTPEIPDNETYIHENTLLLNGDFETANVTWDFPAGWAVWEGNPIYVSEDKHSGTCSIKLNGDSESWKGIQHTEQIYVTAGNTYRFGAWVKTQSPSTESIHLNINRASIGSHNIITSDGWKYIYNDWTATSTENITVQVDAYISLGESTYIDDVEFYLLSVPEDNPTTGGTTTISICMPLEYGYTELYMWNTQGTICGAWPGLTFSGYYDDLIGNGVQYAAWQVEINTSLLGTDAQFIFSHEDENGYRTQTSDSEVFPLRTTMIFDHRLNGSRYQPVLSYHSEMNASVEMSSAVSELSSDATTYNLATEMATLPTAEGMNSRLELIIVNKSGKETVMTKDLDYPFESNKHYKFDLVVKRNERGFEFNVEDIIEEDIEIDLN